MVHICFSGGLLCLDVCVGEEDFLCLIGLICCAGVGLDVEFDLVF